MQNQAKPQTPERRVPTKANNNTSVLAVPVVLLAVAGLVSGPALAIFYDSNVPNVVDVRLTVPAEIAGWRTSQAYNSNYRPSISGADAVYENVYRSSDEADVYVYMGYYRRQEQGKEAVYYANRVYDGENWKADSVARRTGPGSRIGMWAPLGPRDVSLSIRPRIWAPTGTAAASWVTTRK